MFRTHVYVASEKNLLSVQSKKHINSNNTTSTSKHFKKNNQNSKINKINSAFDYLLKFENDLGSHFGFFASALDDERKPINSGES